MIQHARAARLEYRLQRCGGEWSDVSVRYIVSRKAIEGTPGTWCGPAYYIHKGGLWRCIGKYISGADSFVRQVEDEGTQKPPPPSPAEVFGVILQVAGAVLGIVKDLPRKAR